ncbi:hypothetical protein DICVIV_04472 [Dictyocaulus viviparus]|uniref:Uncharacterized protein n=1 Tax=Dictyocaulus viviparus TaxID=29172 RepID=A0A0D8Y037_DICVI|nr:hypothetical protein DICVIV_04472 [Dictyocaulus viviparus]
MLCVDFRITTSHFIAGGRLIHSMTSTRPALFCIMLIVLQAFAQEKGKIYKQVAFSRDVPTWRSSMRVRQVSVSSSFI